jgi:2,3-bisphosphoglycerate-dependent phosphoglycerate mutase
MGRLILLRHGQSQWNKKDLFTGWVDVPLSPQGIEEAMHAGDLMKDIPIDVIFTSTLIRAQMTAMLAMTHHSTGKVPVMLHENDEKLAAWGKIYDESTLEEVIPTFINWELNERMYGCLQGRNKEATRKEFSPEQVKLWRRSFDQPPPEGESLEMTAQRTLPFFEKTIFPYLSEGKNILICAHGNSLRSIVMKLDNLTKEEVLSLEIPTGEPFEYQFNEGEFFKQPKL